MLPWSAEMLPTSQSDDVCAECELGKKVRAPQSTFVKTLNRDKRRKYINSHVVALSVFSVNEIHPHRLKNATKSWQLCKLKISSI